ncbi:thiol-disulfide oxidoreductase DCC family protein [Bacillus massiliigorillae]|uniref:thiol-disulfide oxidoreductase DCC family protein n=1 Tax=Bacillus massiliigorillae TaxID=1243664 RepID=UPI0003A41499|nr:DCC1-like thiol-disulfide oxidoreductase family protein [Bacillus massiliigorillae]
MNDNRGIILFDGQCNLCNHSVHFILKRDHKQYFRFASLQSEVGQSLLELYQLPMTLNSVVFINKGIAYIESDAPIHICQHLKGLWKLLYVAKIIPTPLRNYCYRVIAKKRYQWWGKSTSCMLPTPDIKKRFLS